MLIVLGSERETAENFGISEKELSDELKTAHQILFEERNKRPRPHLDDKIVLSWNGKIHLALQCTLVRKYRNQ